MRSLSQELLLSIWVKVGHIRFGVHAARSQMGWLTIRPMPVAALETVTQGVARATSHRVLSPRPGSTPRYSIPFFQNIAQGICVGESVLTCEPSSILQAEHDSY